MASYILDRSRKSFADGGIALLTDTIVAYLVDDADFTPNQNTSEFLNEIAAGARVAGPVTLGSKTTTDGVFDAADITFTAVTGDQSEAIYLVKSTGTESTSRIICRIDSANMTGLPVTPNGGNINVTWDNGSNKIFKL